MRLPKRGAGGVVCCAPPPPSGESAQSCAMLRSPRRRHPTGLPPLSPKLAHLHAEQAVQDNRDSHDRHHLLGDGGALPPPAMMAPGELAVDRACGGAGATGGITTSFSRPSSSFPTSLHHDSPAAPWTCSGSIPTVRLNQCCWLMRQGDIPRLSGVDRGLLDVRRAGRRRATLMGLPLERFQAACRGDACDELEVGNPD